ncbi:putative type II secretion system protein E [bioreactor metagenome]|uniref:Putative type II secretion system protein E n=1 Tax=bioreactor metagenome TaxID=1076179 RepID=A0A644WLY0_9ZZZZ
MKPFKKKLGEMLMESGEINQNQLQDALEEQKSNWKRLGDILVDLGYVTDGTLADTIAKQIAVERVNLQNTYIDAAIARLIPKEVAKKYTIIPIYERDGIVYVAMSDPRNMYALDDLRLIIQKPIRSLIASSSEIEAAIEVYYSQQMSERAIEDLKRDWSVDTIGQEADNSDIQNAPAVRLANSIISQAVTLKASDIHIEPFEQEVQVRFRIDGSLVENMTIPQNLYSAVSTRFKVIAGINIAEKRVPQDGRIEMTISGKNYDFRVSTLPTVFGEKIVIRILDRTSFLFTREMLGFTKENSRLVDAIIKKTNGIVLLTGPTGSGKSTTLYSLLRELNTPELNIVTIEDPVEYMLHGINQVQVNVKAGLTFAAGLRSILRQDPDIVMIGEIRDEETAEIAVRASITGHLVLSTLHTNDAPSSVARLVDMGIEPFLVAESLSGIIAQRLVRRLCNDCKKKALTTPAEMEIMLLDKPAEICHPVGCPKCNGTGYKGRISLHEVMHINRPLRDAIQEEKSTEVLRDIAKENGMMQLFDSCKQHVLEGTTSLNEMVKTVYVRD